MGIGASAGGLEAFSELLSNLPSGVAMAFVLVQHPDPKHASLLTELLTRRTPLPVVEVSPGTRVEPAHVYVIPPNATMTVADGVLALSPRPAASTPHMPVDVFLRSLAEDRGDKAIGVVLSGSASDGVLGIKAIKGEGGLTFAQDPATARHDGMPRSAIASGAVDFVLPPRDIAHALVRIGGHPYVRDLLPAPRDYAQAIVDTVRTALVILDEDFRVRSANRAFYEIFQVAPEATINHVLFALGNGQWEIPALRRVVREVADTGTPFENFAVEHEFPSIGFRIMLVNARRIRGESDTGRTILLAIEDVTDRRQAEREPRASEEIRYRRLFETTKDGIVLVDADTGQITNANPFWLILTGRNTASVIGRRLWEIGVFEDPALIRTIFHDLQTRDAARNEDVDLVGPDGGRRHVELAATAYLLGGKKVIQYIVRDITEHMQILQRERTARADAEAANRAKDEFLSVLSHELRTPLTAMLGWTRVLRRGAIDPSKTNAALETIERNTRLLAQLIEDLLDVSRIAAGKLAIELQRVDMAVVVRAAAETVRDPAEAKGLALELHLPDAPPIVRGDRNRLQQVVWNLLSNALKFTPNGGRIDVTLQAADMAARLTVSDTGRGISPELLPRIFERFRQGESVSTRTQGGLGLGLAIVRHLVDLHGGQVSVVSGGEGRGATFTIALPLAPASSPSEREGDDGSGSADGMPDDVRLDGLRVLLVEDEQDTGRMLAQVLGERGAQVTYVETAAAALAELDQVSPDVIVSDIGLPGEDGYELLHRVRSSLGGARLPAIALTAFAREEDIHRAREAGFDLHLAKPVEPAMLVRVTAQLARPAR